MNFTDDLPGRSPKLWNPNAAANWSLLFTPVFGAWLHAKNWQALGQLDQASISMRWVWCGFLFLAIVPFLPDSLGSAPGIGFVFAWYFTSAKAQIKYISEHKVNYNKQSWIKPLLIGLAGIVIYYFAILGIVTASQPSLAKVLEIESVDIVTKIVREQLGGTSDCSSVSLGTEVSEGHYNAVANLDGGKKLNITIKSKDGQIFVEIPRQ